MIQFTTVTLLYSFASSLGDFQYVNSVIENEANKQVLVH